ncbi:isoquinoline 1-oxidoreductase, beta subunit [Rhizobiales bacterium GAS191]|nr:isoquinoline 1-oxidoreductase, beta subunit [Rhizobiales bacterium GAS113]SEC43296.1 isoquinoline 1-oxidoreductase, beta subunit [Rhizobiales bacterium GAS191]
MTQINHDARSAVIENISRRGLLQGALATGGLVLAAQFPGAGAGRAEDAPKYGADGMPHGTVNSPQAFISIAPDGTVSIVCHRSEMGQGVRTGMPLIVADELEADWSRVKVVQATGDEAKFGNQDTDGSRSTRHFMQPMRECGAAARMMLEGAAAKRWGVSVAEVEAKNHQVVHKPSGKTLGYGELAADAALQPVPSDGFRLKDPSQFRYIGKGETNIVDGFAITTGRAIYGQDVRLPGMKYAVIARPPVMGGKVASYDASAALKVPGVEKVVEIAAPPSPSVFLPMGGLAVVAANTFAAVKGREALKITWDDGPHASYESKAYRAALEQTAGKPGQVARQAGDLDAAMGKAAKTVTAQYYIPHLAHATMEPPSATVRIVDGKCECWTSVQSPQAAHDLLAQTLGIAPENVTVNVTLLGGGFGRKSKPDYVVEAGLVSKAMGGAPVKVVWMREDDIHNGFYHTVSVERLEAGLDAAGKTIAWRHNSVAPTIMSTFEPDPRYEANWERGQGLVDMPFDIANLRIENGEAQAHTRIGWFRSVSNISHAFAIQAFAGELAAAAGKDQKDYILDLIGPARIVDVPAAVKDFWDYGENPETYPVDTGRLRKVVELAAEKGEWGRKLPQGHGLGIAVHRSFVTYVAAVVEAAVDAQGNVTVPRVDIAVDCGPTVNPDRIRSQLEGACIMGLTLALKSEISFKDGKVQQSNFDDYDVLRINEAPRETRVHIVPHGFDMPLGGVGEPGVPPIAPALVNAIFAATGKRIRDLPIGGQLRA